MGQPLTSESKRIKSEKCRLSKLGRNNPMWKDKIDIGRSLHRWVNRNIGKPKICEKCGISNNIDLTNTTGIYERYFSNWKYLCRKHHMESDGRLGVFLDFAFNYGKRYKGV